MSQKESTSKTRKLHWALLAQAFVVVAGLLLSLAPTPGEAALYLPLHATTTRHALDWSRAHGMRLVGSGPVEGSLILTGSGFSQALSAFGDGAILINAPAALCGSPPASNRSSIR